MKNHTKMFLFLCLSIAIVPTSSLAEEPDDSAALDNAYHSVIRECNNLASKFDLRTAAILSKKDWTEKQKTELMALTHNHTLQSCVLNMAIELKKYAERIAVKSGK